MSGIYLEVPSGAADAAGAHRLPLEVELKRRLVAEMYADELVGGSSACLLGNLEKELLHHWLGCHGHVPPLGRIDYELERRNLVEWLP